MFVVRVHAHVLGRRDLGLLGPLVGLGVLREHTLVEDD